MVTGVPGCTLPTSVSSTSAETCTVSRFAIRSRTVPPPTSLVGLEITVPSSTFFWMIVPLSGARTWVSSIASCAVWRLVFAFTSCAFACAKASFALSYSVSVIAWDLNSVSARASCARALASCASATSSAACACSRLARGIRGSIFASSWPGRTSSPVSTGMPMISPDALDFTSTVRIGWTVPAADADTTMSRRSTGTFSYSWAGSARLQPAKASVRAAAAAARVSRFTVTAP